jgi:thiamine-phosphate pyrophosphorylase
MSAPRAARGLDPCLCLVTDRSFVPDARFLDTVAAAIEGGATMVQLRDKGGKSDRAVYEEGLLLRALCAERGVPFLVDDRLDLAMALEADGIHLGQDDLPLSAARRLWRASAIYGVSASSIGEALAAEREGADYVGVGAVFPTATKGDARCTGLSGLRDIVGAVGIPVMAIGGIGIGNAAGVMASGCAALAVISAIWSSEDPRRAAEALARVVRFGRCNGV